MTGNDKGANGKVGYDLDARLDFDATNPGMSGLELGMAPAAPAAAPASHTRPESTVDGHAPALSARPTFRPIAPAPTTTVVRAPLNKPLAVAVVLLAIACLWLCLRKTTMPDLLVTDAEKNPLHLTDLHGGHPKVLFVFLASGDPLGPFTLNAIRAESARTLSSVAVVGLTIGTQADADHLHTSLELPFPVYSLRDAPDPFVVQDFLKKAGIEPRRVYASTTLLLDEQQHLLFTLQGNEVRDLPQKLAAIAP